VEKNMKNLDDMKNYLMSWMDEDNDYLDSEYSDNKSDRFEFYACMCGVSPFVLKNWLLGRGRPNWKKVKDALDETGVAYIKGN
jgi:hypothetical protein